MAISQLTIDFFIEKLSLVNGLSCKRMFGGVGFFSNKKMFGMLNSSEEFRFKVDDSNRQRYEQRGMKPMEHPRGTMPYYLVPKDIYDDPELLNEWAELSIAITKKK